MKYSIGTTPQLFAAFASLLIFSFLNLPSVSEAKDGDIIKRGRCPGGLKSKLKASPENGRIEVEYEVDHARPGERWRVEIKKDGKTILRKTRRANGRGEVEVRKVTSNGPGKERISATAKSLSRGRRCSLSLRVPF